MTYRGRVRNGTVVLDDPAVLPDGTEVTIRRSKPAHPATKRPAKKQAPKPAPPTLDQRLKPVIGKAVTLPPDMSANHDHYLYGVPKQQKEDDGKNRREKTRRGPGRR